MFCGCINTPSSRELPLQAASATSSSWRHVPHFCFTSMEVRAMTFRNGLQLFVWADGKKWSQLQRQSLQGWYWLWPAWRTQCFSWQVCFQCCSDEEQTQALSQSVSMWTEMSGHTGSFPPFLSLWKPQDFGRTRCQPVALLVTLFSEAVGNSGALPNALVALVREDGDQWYHDTLLEFDVSQYPLKIFAGWRSWAT